MVVPESSATLHSSPAAEKRGQSKRKREREKEKKRWGKGSLRVRRDGGYKSIHTDCHLLT